ncbi:Type II secretion system F domain protein [Thermodesulfatator indicus DSM 15286]|uniref:Type II secretion system F domain protein n=1 Tax=Thermodesulfatator indicus (strain DSM 15286 / JCM 11887 / CIR29812) TaxID=667014 RepID=F8ACA6_THEID|nr:type II secretion system F family protein [Thermodesulfatator indicus]AEH45741.1 Type II secretion system F domain protein [Thermodesulfatator indicus DSM 15286]
MPEFVYEALEPATGRRIKDEGYFEGPLELLRWLERRGLILIRYRLKKRYFWEELFAPKVTRVELAEFCRNLAFMIRGGVPLIQALEDLEKTAENKTLAKAIRKLRQNVEEGKPFYESIKEHPKVFYPIVQALTLVGEETGRLDETLYSAAEHLLRVDEIISTTKRALIYPAFILVSMTGALAFWIFFVLPRILTLFQEMKVKLPLATRILIALVSFCTSNWFYFLAVPFGLVVAGLFVWKVPRARFYFEKIILKLPLVGKVRRTSFMAFFFEYTALLLEAGVNLMRTLEIMQESLKNPYMDEIIMTLKNRIEEGFSFFEACEGTGFFSPLELRMVKVGEETGRLVDQLRYLADYYYQRLERLVATLSKMLEPILITVAGLLFLIIVLALIGPIYDMISQIGKF